MILSKESTNSNNSTPNYKGKLALIVIAVLLVIGLTNVWRHRNECVSLEERVKAQYATNQSNYDNMWKKFLEITQVTGLQANQIKETYMGLIQGRYQDPNLLFKMVKEDNPKLNTDVYTQIQREISAGRNTFDNNQKAITDVIRTYNENVRRYIVMTFLTGRETMNMNDYIVTSERTDGAFKSKKDDVIDITGGKK